MLRYPCLILDHDDTVVQSETTVNYPYFCLVLSQFRPGATITSREYTEGCYHLGFTEMCRKYFQFTELELAEEYAGWLNYVDQHIPAPYPGIDRVIRRQKAAGGLVCVVSQSGTRIITRDYQTHFGVTPDAIYSWDLPQAYRKPNPYSLRDIMQRYRLSADQLLVVDDMKPAWEMASAVGAPIAFAAWGKLDFPEVSREMQTLCDHTFQTPADLERFLFDSEIV